MHQTHQKLHRAWRSISLNSSIEFQNLTLACLGQPWFHQPREFTSVTDYRRLLRKPWPLVRFPQSGEGLLPACHAHKMFFQREARVSSGQGSKCLDPRTLPMHDLHWSPSYSIRGPLITKRHFLSWRWSSYPCRSVSWRVLMAEWLGKCCIMLYHAIIGYISIFPERIRIHPGELICNFMWPKNCWSVCLFFLFQGAFSGSMLTTWGLPTSEMTTKCGRYPQQFPLKAVLHSTISAAHWTKLRAM